jgi:hypothetical protein
MMVEMLTGNRPFAEFDNPMKAMNFIANSTERVTVPASITESCKSAADFIALCLQRDPLQRPPASALLSHYFIRSNVELSMFFDASQMDGESGDVFGASSRREESASFYSLAEPQQPDSREEAAQQEMIRASLIKDVETKTNVVVLSQGQQPNKDGEPGAPAASPVEILISDGAPVPLGGSQARSEVTMLDAVNGGGGMSTRPSGRQGSVIIAGSISGQEQHQSAAAHQPAARLVPHVMESLLRSLQAEMMLAANAGHSIGGRTVREGNADDENDDEAAGEESDQEDVSSGGRIKKKKDEEGEDGGKKQSHHPAGGGGSARQRQQSSSGVSIRASSHLPWTSLQIFRSLVLVAMLGAFSGLLALLAKSW